MVRPCIHGNLCRGYLRLYGRIYSEDCPTCPFYEPMVSDEDKRHKDKPHKIVIEFGEK